VRGGLLMQGVGMVSGGEIFDRLRRRSGAMPGRDGKRASKSQQRLRRTARENQRQQKRQRRSSSPASLHVVFIIKQMKFVKLNIRQTGIPVLLR
jgi:hypothetical protein